MRIKPHCADFKLPTKGTKGAGAFDIYMPESGAISGSVPRKIHLGFSAEIPEGHVAILLPRSGAGANFGVELNNTVGILDSDYRGEWMASMRTKNEHYFSWERNERILQFMIVPIANVELELCYELSETERGAGGFGSSGKL